MGNRNLTFGSSGRFKLRLPHLFPSSDDEHAANWKTMGEQWDAAPFPYRFGVTVRRTANQSINDNTATAIDWQAADYDDNKFWSGSGSTTNLKVPVGGAGLYVGVLTVPWDRVLLVVNPLLSIRRLDASSTDLGTFGTVRLFNPAATGNTDQRMQVMGLSVLNDGDLLQGIAFHGASGGARNLDVITAASATNTLSPRFDLYRFAIFG